MVHLSTQKRATFIHKKTRKSPTETQLSTVKYFHFETNFFSRNLDIAIYFYSAFYTVFNLLSISLYSYISIYNRSKNSRNEKWIVLNAKLNISIQQLRKNGMITQFIVSFGWTFLCFLCIKVARFVGVGVPNLIRRSDIHDFLGVQICHFFTISWITIVLFYFCGILWITASNINKKYN